MTVFVGPNNSGKSLALRELEAFLESGGGWGSYIVEAVDPDLPPAGVVREMVLSRQVTDAAAGPPPPGLNVLMSLGPARWRAASRLQRRWDRSGGRRVVGPHRRIAVR